MFNFDPYAVIIKKKSSIGFCSVLAIFVVCVLICSDPWLSLFFHVTLT